MGGACFVELQLLEHEVRVPEPVALGWRRRSYSVCAACGADSQSFQ